MKSIEFCSESQSSYFTEHLDLSGASLVLSPGDTRKDPELPAVLGRQTHRKALVNGHILVMAPHTKLSERHVHAQTHTRPHTHMHAHVHANGQEVTLPAMIAKVAPRDEARPSHRAMLTPDVPARGN